jgi:hypothetical protein
MEMEIITLSKISQSYQDDCVFSHAWNLGRKRKDIKVKWEILGRWEGMGEENKKV